MKLAHLITPLRPAPRLDGRRLKTLILLRWIALAGSSLATLLAWWFGFQGIAWLTLVMFIILGVMSNTLLSWVAESIEGSGFYRIYYRQIVLDIAALTGLLWASGGLSNPFATLFLLHVVVAALIGTFSSVIAAGGMASFAAVLLHLLETYGLLIGHWLPPPGWDDTARLAALLVNAVAIAGVVGSLSRRFQVKEARLDEVREAVKLREQVLERVLNGLSAAVEVVEADRVVWQNEAMGSIRSLQPGNRWLCPGAQNGCNRAGQRPDGTCDEGGLAEAHSCLLSIPRDDGAAVYRKFTWQVRSDHRVETVHLYVDETRQLAEAERLRLTERLASLGRMAQGIAHELNTPLATVQTLTRDIGSVLEHASGVSPEDRADVEDSITLSLKELERCARITRGLLRGRGLESSSARPLVQSVAQLTQDAVTLVSVGNRRSHQFDVKLEGLTAFVDSDAFIQVLVNLLTNAVDASPGGSTIEIGGEVEGERVRLDIADRGIGLASSIRPRLFEPFATTKEVGKGTGLGLYMARLLLTEVGGTLELVPREGGGTIARMRLRTREMADSRLDLRHAVG